jgi:hypothetical protein
MMVSPILIISFCSLLLLHHSLSSQSHPTPPSSSTSSSKFSSQLHSFITSFLKATIAHQNHQIQIVKNNISAILTLSSPFAPSSSFSLSSQSHPTQPSSSTSSSKFSSQETLLQPSVLNQLCFSLIPRNEQELKPPWTVLSCCNKENSIGFCTRKKVVMFCCCSNETCSVNVSNVSVFFCFSLRELRLFDVCYWKKNRVRFYNRYDTRMLLDLEH